MRQRLDPFASRLQKLLEVPALAPSTSFIAEALDRLSRDQEDGRGLYKHLDLCGIKLLTLPKARSRAPCRLKGTMNALSSKDLAAKTIAVSKVGCARKLRRRVCFATTSFARSTRAASLCAAGAPSTRPNPQSSCASSRTFPPGSRRARSPSAQSRRHPRTRGGRWVPPTINGNRERGTGILNNELYIDRLVWNRLHYLKDPRTGKRISRQNEPDALIVQDVRGARIVPQDLWDLAKQRLDTPSRQPQPRTEAGLLGAATPAAPGTGLAKCGACGSSYVKISANLFGCAAARDRGGTCANRRTSEPRRLRIPSSISSRRGDGAGTLPGVLRGVPP